MTSRTELLKGLREHHRELQTKIHELEGERTGVEAAISALNPNGAPKKGKRKRRNRHARNGRGHYEAQILDHLRAHPQTRWTSTELERVLDIPQNSCRAAVKQLAESGRVEHVEDTPRGTPVIRHRPHTVVPGQPVNNAG